MDTRSGASGRGGLSEARPWEEVAAFRLDAQKHPSLCKAQQALASAELLRGQGRLDCAANRYYYAVLHAASQFLGYRTPSGQKWDHSRLADAYVKGYDNQAYPAFTAAQLARNRADYSPIPVSDWHISHLLVPVAETLKRAMRKASVQGTPNDSR